MAAASPAPPGNFQVARPACWFPLALFGVIVAMSVPLYAAQLSTSAFSGWLAYGPLTRTMSSTSGYGAFYSTLAGTLGPDTGLTGIAEGWYWAAALTAGFLVTAVWYRRAGRRAGPVGPGRGYLIAGLVLTAAVTAVPLLLMPGASFPAWIWLSGQWASGSAPSALLVTGGDPLRTLVAIGSRGQSAAAALLPALVTQPCCWCPARAHCW